VNVPFTAVLFEIKAQHESPNITKPLPFSTSNMSKAILFCQAIWVVACSCLQCLKRISSVIHKTMLIVINVIYPSSISVCHYRGENGFKTSGYITLGFVFGRHLPRHPYCIYPHTSVLRKGPLYPPIIPYFLLKIYWNYQCWLD